MQQHANEEIKEQPIPPDLDLNQVFGAQYSSDHQELSHMMDTVGSDTLIEKAYKHVIQTKKWKDATNMKKCCGKWKKQRFVHHALMNAIVKTSYKGYLFFVFVAHVKGRRALIFTNETHYWKIIDDFLESLRSKHVRLI